VRQRSLGRLLLCGRGWRGCGRFLLARREHRAHASGRVGGRGGAAGHLEQLVGVVPGDQRTRDLVGQHAGAQPAHGRVADEAQGVGAGVELDAFGRAFDGFIDAIALLAKARRPLGIADRHGLAVAVGTLAQFHSVGAQHHRALADDHVAIEDDHLALQVDAAGLVRLDRHRLAAVGPLRLGRQPRQTGHDQSGRGQAADGEEDAGSGHVLRHETCRPF
jgi:hypothetical protein